MKKEVILEALQEMPEDISLDDLMERLILLQSFAKGREQQQEGRTFTHDEVGERLAQWLK